MRRGLVVAVLITALVAAAALGAFNNGNYRGRTGKGAGVSFRASQSAVTSFTFSVLLTCSNGSPVGNTTTLSRIPIRAGRFTSTSSTISVKGTLDGNRANGTVSVTNPKTPGGRNCRSGSVGWTAKRGGTSNAGALVCSPAGNFNGGDLQVDMSCNGEYDAFVVRIPRPATRADTSTAHLRCLAGRLSGNGESTDMVNCSAQDGVKLRSGRVLIRFTDNATCADAKKTTVSALRTGKAEDGPFPLRANDC